MTKKIRVGTRRSQLAMWQAENVASTLQAAGFTTEIIPIETKGDQVLQVTLSKIGSKGVFTEEIEQQLAAGDIDIAVHSAKDMPSKLPEGFELLAFTKRETENDVLVSALKDIDLTDTSRQLKIGTSSTRRVAQLLHYHPHVKPVSIRGNLQRRIAKMEEGQCDALLLAYAGVHRMNYDHMIAQHLPLEKFTPATGQGSLAIEIYETIDPELAMEIKSALNHGTSEVQLRAERTFLKRLEGGCSVPVFCLAQSKANNLSITGGVISLDGQKCIRESVSGEWHEYEYLGSELAERVLRQGGETMLREIKQQLAED